jgi:hypothetical protein
VLDFFEDDQAVNGHGAFAVDVADVDRRIALGGVADRHDRTAWSDAVDRGGEGLASGGFEDEVIVAGDVGGGTAADDIGAGEGEELHVAFLPDWARSGLLTSVHTSRARQNDRDRRVDDIGSSS